MPDRTTLATEFPAAVTYERYLARVEKVVAPMGFDREHTFAAVSVCRDELTQSLLAAVSGRWGQPFSLGGLGAFPSLGRTGWRAVLSHVPADDGRGRLIVFGFPHLGIDPEGIIGRSLRHHQREVTPTCGALSALLASLEGGNEPLPPGLDDHEADRLRRLVGSSGDGLSDDLLALTRQTARAVDAEMWAELDALGAHRSMDVAVFCGIQIHLPDDVDHILATSSACKGVDGERRTLHI